jgi:2-polyprenyl-3-methyl-5-hydroxy-6-metoxy-1,4-benzoquinol methylase
MLSRPRSSRPCPYCGSSSRRAFAARDWNQHTSDERYQYRICTTCSLTFIDSVPAELSRVYRQEQFDIPATSDREAFQARADAQAWKADILKSLVPTGALLEVGPATGEFAYVARQAGFTPTLVEMDGDCCRFLREVLGLDVLEAADPGDALGGKRYEAICLWQTIEHIPEFWGLLSRCGDALASGGILIVSTPNPESLQARILCGYWPHVDAPRHLYLVPPAWLDRFAAGRGLDVVMNTTRDVGSLGLNYYGWYLAIRNHARGLWSESRVQRAAAWVTERLRPRESVEGAGCSFTTAFRKK